MSVIYILPLILAPLGVLGHGNMVWPNTWFDQGGWVGLTPGGQCRAAGLGVASCMWFTNFTFIPGQPTLPDEMRTFQDMYIEGMGNYDWTKTNPWRAPGSAPVYSPCGVAGGNPDGCPVGGDEGDCPGGGFGYGPAAEDVLFEDVVTTEWKLGGTAEVGWGIIANHGGGYSYRLCKTPEEGVVTEECFQQMPLQFAGDMQWVQYGEDGEKVEFLANRTTVGTFPPGSQWTKDPIPACGSLDGGWYEGAGCTESGTQFPPPAPGLAGYGENYLAPGEPEFKFTIMDKVQVPSDIIPGDYVLSFRWDCEQTSQIWNACANIKIVE